MFTSAEVVEALRRRRRRSIRPEATPDGMPKGWADWFASLRPRAGRVTGATSAAIIAVLTARPPPARRRHPGPRTRLHAWASLVHPLWEPRPRDERGLRRLSLAGTLLAQVVWLGLLTVLMQARFLAGEAPAALGEAHVVQAVFIGDGTPDTPGGGAEAGEPPVQPDPLSEPPSSRTARAAPPAPGASAPVPPEVAAEPSEAPPDEASAQVLQVTETPMPDIDFTLPPPRPRAALPEVEVRERAIPGAPMQAVEVPRLRTPEPVAAPEDVIATRQLEVEIRERALPGIADVAPVPAPVRREVALEALDMPVRDLPQVAARERTVPLRSPSPSDRPAATASTGVTAPSPAAAPGAGRRADMPPAASGSGPDPSAAAGAPPSARVSDDWGDGSTVQDGGQRGRPSGLFGADGRPRLADGGRVGGGLPPGTITEDFARIDREGTWLRRPPTDYEPTSFDRFWVPSETLLEEWVRRSVRTVLIPIPGTSKTIQCNVALLAFGGGCGITDPNMQDVETDGRPPPDVPWKPELQEDQDSLGG